MKAYRRESVGAKKSRWAVKAEAFEDALSLVSQRLGVIARRSAAELRAERLAAARGSGASSPAAPDGLRRDHVGPVPDTPSRSGDRSLVSPASRKRNAATRASGARASQARQSLTAGRRTTGSPGRRSQPGSGCQPDHPAGPDPVPATSSRVPGVTVPGTARLLLGSGLERSDAIRSRECIPRWRDALSPTAESMPCPDHGRMSEVSWKTACGRRLRRGGRPGAAHRAGPPLRRRALRIARETRSTAAAVVDAGRGTGASGGPAGRRLPFRSRD